MKPTIPEVLPLVKKWYKKHPCGGVFHIVLDDGNCEQSHIEYCLAAAVESGDEEAIHLGHLLAAMSRTQRAKLYRMNPLSA